MDLYLNPVFAFISLSMLMAILKAAFGLGFVIFVHELGHFLVGNLAVCFHKDVLVGI